MLPSNTELLKHIRDEIVFIIEETSTITFQNFVNNGVLKRAVIRSLEIIGEASKKIHPDFKSIHPEIDWRGMAGTRDKLIHDYFGVDYELVWDIIQNNLSELKIIIEDTINEI